MSAALAAVAVELIPIGIDIAKKIISNTDWKKVSDNQKAKMIRDRTSRLLLDEKSEHLLAAATLLLILSDESKEVKLNRRAEQAYKSYTDSIYIYMGKATSQKSNSYIQVKLANKVRQQFLQASSAGAFTRMSQIKLQQALANLVNLSKIEDLETLGRNMELIENHGITTKIEKETSLKRDTHGNYTLKNENEFNNKKTAADYMIAANETGISQQLTGLAEKKISSTTIETNGFQTISFQ